MLEASGYRGEKLVFMHPTDQTFYDAMCQVALAAFQKVGLNVDDQSMDWGTVVQRRTKKDPVSAGGWSILGTFWAGLDQGTPANNAFLRGPGESGAFGWPKSERIEALRQQWLDAPDLPAQKSLAAEIQKQALIDVPYVPIGQYFFPTVYQNNVSGVLDGPPLFWNVRKT